MERVLYLRLQINAEGLIDRLTCQQGRQADVEQAAGPDLQQLTTMQKRMREHAARSGRGGRSQAW